MSTLENSPYTHIHVHAYVPGGFAGTDSKNTGTPVLVHWLGATA